MSIIPHLKALNITILPPNIYLQLEDKGANVKKLQTMLKKMGYYKDTKTEKAVLDGVYSPLLADAVRRFRLDFGLYEDTVLDEEACSRLNLAILTNQTIKTKKKYWVEDEGVTSPNLLIDDMPFVLNSITFDTPYNASNWSNVQLMNGKYLDYPTSKERRSFTADAIISWNEYAKMRDTLKKLKEKQCTVICFLAFPTKQKCTVNVNVALEKKTHVKLKFKITSIGG
jgi:peptidoglycan hydrolase-like protein with peptidoglycan-binding domain